MSIITTHILDATLGKPASDVLVRLFILQDEHYILLDQKTTDQDGRVKNFDLPICIAGTYQIQFETLPYFAAQQQQCFYPRVSIEFMVTALDRHYHVPLLISPFSYSTYRGS
ncbi:hydroxyisourate hydrolase [Alkanindiges illinoisensis]|uniref:hydroxyisourate hydrolase n=1 Tax=Alkanindiges illinoisensis TaxID=197183 RepID=UPI00047BBFE8|nr:hydroxyisourate hydrolase [Alkanindiges illinoisensis]